MSYKVLVTDLQLMDRDVRLSCLVSDGRLIEARCRQKTSESLLGNIYIGRVQKVVKNIHAAFIEIAPKKTCYYSLEREDRPIFVRKQPSDALVQGDEVLIQIAKEEIKTKTAMATGNLSLSGRYVVLTSGKTQIGFSGRLPKEQKERFRRLTEAHYHGKFGLIVRTNAQNASDEEFLAEMEQIFGQLADLIEKAGTRTCFSCLHRAGSRYLSYLTDSYQNDLQEVITDLPEVYREIADLAAQSPFFPKVPLRLYEDRMLSLSRLYELEHQIQQALQKKVWLPSGGYLVIEPTEALTVIDVNTGKSAGKRNPEEHFLKINLEAAEEIAFQIRLRNLSGIILVDFIGLQSEEDRRQLMDTLKQEVKKDPVPTKVVDMTRLELVELTRKKIEKSLAEQLT